MGVRGEGRGGEGGGARLTAGGGRGERVEVSPPEVATLAAQRKGRGGGGGGWGGFFS